MNANITWPALLHCYDSIEFRDAPEGILTVRTEEILQTLLLVNNDDGAANDANLYPIGELKNPGIGDLIPVHVGAPKLSLGILAKDLQSLLSAPKAYIEFPQRFYVISGRLSERELSAEPLRAYRAVVLLVQLLAEAAAFMDQLEQKLFYFKDGKIEIPVRYSSDLLRRVNVAEIERLLKHFNADALHRAQKLTILADVITSLVRSQPVATRFEYVLQNVNHVIAGVDDGYRLFVSSFSYDKIRSDLENASLEFILKIQKTFVDIQGQLLGIPIATVVVASQLKAASACGTELWTNVAILAGAWIFVVFLTASIVNQFLTLNAISGEVQRQKKRLVSEFAAIAPKFLDIFTSLTAKIAWYRVLYIVIGAIGVAGAVFATLAYQALTTTSATGCILPQYR